MEYHAIHGAARVVSRYGIFRSVPVFGGHPQMFSEHTRTAPNARR
jgi:hypothetical protein